MYINFEGVSIKLIFLTLLIIISFTSNVFANCSNSFEEISKDCLKKASPNFDTIKFIVDSDSEKMRGQTFLFQTENKVLGKFIIQSTLSTKEECLLNLNVTSYDGKSPFFPNSTLRIEKKFNSWNSDRAGFARKTGNDFELKNYKGQCVFLSNQAKGVFFKKFEPEALIQGREILFYFACGLIFLAVFLVARAVFQDEDKFKAQSQLEDADKEEDNSGVANDIILKYSKPFFKRYFSPVVSNMKSKKKIKEKYKRKLAASGLNKVLTPEDFFAFKLFLIIGFPILFLGLREFLEETWPLSMVPIISAVGFMYPDIWINGKIQRRKEEILLNMPFLVDMLALSVEAGLDFMAAIQKVLAKAKPSALTDEFEILIKETRVGASRAEGLRQLAWRCNCLEISSFTATLIAADSVGASIGPILKTLSVEMREKRSAEAEKKGATAATKILFPMLLFIMPAVMLMIAAPIVLQMMGAE